MVIGYINIFNNMRSLLSVLVTKVTFYVIPEEWFESLPKISVVCDVFLINDSRMFFSEFSAIMRPTNIFRRLSKAFSEV